MVEIARRTRSTLIMNTIRSGNPFKLKGATPKNDLPPPRKIIRLNKTIHWTITLPIFTTGQYLVVLHIAL
jgi:hypothetical protein